MAAYSPISSAKICEENVVPILAPITIPIACRNVNAFEFTSAMVMMMTTEEESRRMVTTIPERTPFTTLLVNRSRKILSLSPEISFSPWDKLLRAYKNSTRPVMISKMEFKAMYLFKDDTRLLSLY